MARFMIEQVEHHFILFSTIFLLIGFILGKNLAHFKYQYISDQEPKSDLKKSKNKRNVKTQKKMDIQEKIPTISIDESTHVVPIKTNDLEKKYETIGENKSTNENINSSISKLKSLRGEK